MAAPAGDGVLAPGRRALTAGLVATVTLVAFEGLAVTTVMPDARDELGGLALYGWAFSAFFLGNLLGIVAAGRAADRAGPARPFVTGLGLFATGLAIAAGAPSMRVLVGGRAVQGLGAGAIPAVAYVVIGRAYPQALRPRMFAVLSSAWVLPGIVGPAISGTVSDAFGWRWVFSGLLPFVAVTGAVTLPGLVRLGPPGGEEPPDRRADALRVTVGAALVLTAASSRAPVVAVMFAFAGVAFGAKALSRLVPRGTLRFARGTPAAVAFRGVLMFAFFGVDAFVPLTLTSLRGASTALAGVALTAATVTWTAGAWVQERRVHDVGPVIFVRNGALLIAFGIGGMVACARSPLPIAVGVLAWGVAGLGMGLAYAPLSLIVLGEAPPGAEGTATAALQLAETLGVALGTGASGALIAAGDAIGWPLATALAVAFVVCGVISLASSGAARRLAPPAGHSGDARGPRRAP